MLKLLRLTPVRIVEGVEPCLSFWVDRLGFKAANQVPGPDGKLVFASVEREGIEVMYQTRASVLAESPGMAADLAGHSVVLFITVILVIGIRESARFNAAYFFASVIVIRFGHGISSQRASRRCATKSRGRALRWRSKL